MPFADLHCHPSFWSFNRIENSNIGCTATDRLHIWDIEANESLTKKEKAGARATYAQSDFASLTAGDVRLVFASLYPIERGFFTGSVKKKYKAEVVLGLLSQLRPNLSTARRLQINYFLRFSNILLRQFFNGNGYMRNIIQKMVMNFSIERIKFFQSPFYDYYLALNNEYQYYRRFNGKRLLHLAPLGTKPYRLITSNGELLKTIAENEEISVVLTIEGMHAIALEPDPAKEGELMLVNEDEISRRIEILKNDWKIFFITFSHHFSNKLAGHAHSLPQLLAEVSDHDDFMNFGINAQGERFIRELLSITHDNRADPRAKRRVLIDVKHMSALSRKIYYEKIVRPFNERYPAKMIPVIASHCGYYGPVDRIKYLDLSYLVSMATDEADDTILKGFYRWNINLCDEDVAIIVSTGGLLGLSFDQRMMGEKAPAEKSLEYWINVMGRQIVGIVVSSIQNVKKKPERIWDCLCIGTDFDGLIDPLDSFPTSKRFAIFQTELTRFLTIISEAQGEYLFLKGNPYTPAEVVEKIAFTNAYKFTAKHLK